MLKIIFIAFLIVFTGISIDQAYSQEIKLSTFQESAQVIIDEKISQTNIASITLLEYQYSRNKNSHGIRMEN